jgi:hypothetical protein
MKALYVIAGVTVLLGALGALIIPGLLPGSRGQPTHWPPPRLLKEFATCQKDFFNNDRDRNGKQDFWRQDIAGLYTLNYPDGERIRLISQQLACADDRPLANRAELGAKAPVEGYWFRAIRHADEAKLSPDRFAACAFPDRYPESGRETFIIDEREIIYKKDLGKSGGIELFPTDPLKEGWRRE